MHRLSLVALFAASAAGARPLPPGTRFAPRCPDHACKSLVATDADGRPLAFTAPHGWGAPDLQAMYRVDPSLGDGVTIAVVDAFGYEAIESDLAVYRQAYGLGPCTIASGCLTVLNNSGKTSPLLPDTDMGWIGETALDVQMVSAICPRCKIVVIQTDGAGPNALQVGQVVAANLGVDAISNSWGGAEVPSDLSKEGDFAHAGVGTFAATGDNGYAGGNSYPATSANVIAVGGVSFDGMITAAWTGAGSACSTVIPRQTWAPSTACTMRASADIAALADPATGVGTYVAAQGGWNIIGGTSAATPIAAALFAAAGHGDARPAFIYKHKAAFTDVTVGTSGSCGSTLCSAATGWDGPTGLGVPDQQQLLAIGNVVGAGPAVQIVSPADGGEVAPGFSIVAAPDSTATWIEVQLDGQRVARLNAEPWTVDVPAGTAEGAHEITVIAYDLDHDSQAVSSTVTVVAAAAPPDTTCNAGGGAGGAPLVALALASCLRRRRRPRPV